jgi:hypothetical protein
MRTGELGPPLDLRDAPAAVLTPADAPAAVLTPADAPLVAAAGRNPRSPEWRDAVVAAAVPWCVARVAVLFSVVLATVATDQLGVARPAPLVDKLLAWDAHQYLAIAEDGYRSIPDGFRFFPGFPLLARGVGFVFGGHPGIAMLVVANACALGAGVALYRLVLRETGQPRTARLAAWFALAAPATVPLAMGYAESLGLLAAVLSFLAVRQSRWRIAALPAAVVGITWSIGGVFAVPLALEAARGWRGASRGERAWRVGTACSPVLAAAAYLAWVQHETGAWWRDVFGVQETVYDRKLAEPFGRLARSAGDLFGGHEAQGIQFIWAVLAIVLIVVAFKRLPASYGAWALVIFLIGISADNIDSFERYLTRAFPLVIAGAVSVRSERAEWVATSLGLAGLVAYGTAIFLVARVP